MLTLPSKSLLLGPGQTSGVGSSPVEVARHGAGSCCAPPMMMLGMPVLRVLPFYVFGVVALVSWERMARGAGSALVTDGHADFNPRPNK